ncbi:hypothetical protein [Prescottella equi]|nr:hypothetical protein [Prescottella equi]
MTTLLANHSVSEREWTEIVDRITPLARAVFLDVREKGAQMF